ncbi:hypothetical protein [Streptomyces litmocidini]|uniref:hypothetical protein n=1 Tax=Streptomyces litmocidini TaxID=67318 RepID=UPI0037004CAA
MTLQELYEHSTSPQVAPLTTAELIKEDRRYYAARRRTDAVPVIGLDIAAVSTADDDPRGKETDGHFHTALHLSRPLAHAALIRCTPCCKTHKPPPLTSGGGASTPGGRARAVART